MSWIYLCELSSELSTLLNWSISLFFSPIPHCLLLLNLHAELNLEAEVEQFYENLQDLLELTPKKYVLFIIGDWNAKVGSQETLGVKGKFGFGVQNEEGQRITEFCQQNALVIPNTLFQQHKR